MAYSDKQHVQIARKEYDDYYIGQKVAINNKKTKSSIGYVVQKNNKSTGEQSYVITDAKLGTAPDKVKSVTILYRGSSTGFSKDATVDWEQNDIPLAEQIIKNGGLNDIPLAKKVIVGVAAGTLIGGLADISTIEPAIAGVAVGKLIGISLSSQIINRGKVGTPQLRSAAQTLQTTLKTYPNAKVSVYGHSLGSMNGQYALASLSAGQLSRIKGAYLYEGPNIYKLLSKSQKKIADQLTADGNVFNYVDPEDLVPIGYSKDDKAVGVWVSVDSKDLGILAIGAQHMWGGYQFDKHGKLKVMPDGALAPLSSDMIKALEAQWRQASGGTLSASQAIFLDAMNAQAITLDYQKNIQLQIDDLKKLYTTEIRHAQELWRTTVSDACRWGEHLSEAERLEVLASAGVTKQTIVHQPVAEYEAKLAVLHGAENDLEKLLAKIQTSISDQVKTDHELANAFKPPHYG